MAAGQMDSSQYPELGYTKCENGFAAAIPGDKNNTFRCNNVGPPFDNLSRCERQLTYARLTSTTSCRTRNWVALLVEARLRGGGPPRMAENSLPLGNTMGQLSPKSVARES